MASMVARLKSLTGLDNESIIAEKLGMSRTAFAERKRRGSIPYEELVRFCDTNSISFNWLFYGEGPLYKSAATKGIEVCEPGTAYKEDAEYVFIPQVSGKISAGGGLVADNTIEMRVAFRREWLQRKGDARNMSIIRVQGDSMEPTLLSGDIVLIDHGRNYVDPHGGIYAIASGDNIMIKRLQLIYPSAKLRIISDNNRYDPIEADPEKVVINGKVIWFGRELER
jgi:phage repressor protein C with HTH and peptisase S24 domain